MLFPFPCLMVYINLRWLFNAKAIDEEDKLRYCLTHNWWEDKDIRLFPQHISSKANITVGVEFELTSNDSAVQLLNHYAAGTRKFNGADQLPYQKWNF